MEPVRTREPGGERVEPLVKTSRDGALLKRPAAVEAEIATALGHSAEELVARAAVTDPEGEGYLSSECMVHLIRKDFRHGSRRLADALVPRLLERCEANLRGSVRGFAGAALQDVREEVLGRLAVSLVEPGGEADFLEVRFALAFKRLRIDVCRRQRRRDRRLVALEDAADADGHLHEADRRALPRALDAEELSCLREALASLDDSERRVLVLHRLGGVPIHSKRPGVATLVGLLGVSERTVRNRLRSAEAKLAAQRKEDA